MRQCGITCIAHFYGPHFNLRPKKAAHYHYSHSLREKRWEGPSRVTGKINDYKSGTLHTRPALIIVTHAARQPCWLIVILHTFAATRHTSATSYYGDSSANACYDYKRHDDSDGSAHTNSGITGEKPKQKTAVKDNFTKARTIDSAGQRHSRFLADQGRKPH